MLDMTGFVHLPVVQLTIYPTVKENAHFTGPVTAWCANRKTYKGIAMIAEISLIPQFISNFKFYSCGNIFDLVLHSPRALVPIHYVNTLPIPVAGRFKD
jgi:hypothetical protein